MNKISKATVDQLSIVLDKWVNLAIADPNGEELEDNALLSVALQALIEDLQTQITGEDRPARSEWMLKNPYYVPPTKR